MEKYQEIIILIFQFNRIKITCNSCTILTWTKQATSNKEPRYLIINNNKV